MIGPILVAVNPYTDACNALTLTAARAQRPELARLVHDAVRHQADTGYPQAIILSGIHRTSRQLTPNRFECPISDPRISHNLLNRSYYFVHNMPHTAGRYLLDRYILKMI